MKLKSNFNYIYEIFRLSLNTQKFLLTLLISIIISMYGVLGLAFGDSYLSGFFNIIFHSMYIVCLMLVIFINTTNTYKIFNQNQFYIIRLKSKKKYLLELIKAICFNNLIILIINFLLIMIGLNMFTTNSITKSIKGYEVSNIIYLIFSIFKLFTIIELISIINVLLFKIINNKIVVLGNILLYALIAGASYSPNTVISSVSNLPLFIGVYIKYQLYSSFIFEILCFLIYCSFILIIINTIKNYVLKHMKEMIE